MENKILSVRKGVLEGTVKLSGAKNSALKLLTASILTDEPIEIYNFPNGLLDIQIHLQMLEVLGKKCQSSGDYVRITEDTLKYSGTLLWDERSIRNTLLILGALTTRFGEGRVPLPGGCDLGDRKYDLHIYVLEQLGAKVWVEEGYLCAKSQGRLIGNDIFLTLRSTGATENAIISASLAKGTTILWNPHIRPEVIDLVNMLNKMGAKISVFGQKCITINGVDKLSGTAHTTIPDNMEALTWAIGSVVTNGDIEIEDFPFEHLEIPLVYLRESGMKYFKGRNSLIVKGGVPYPIEISTGPYPGINSDMQPLFALYGAMSSGKSKIIDLRFKGRYGYISEFAKMGVNYNINGEILEIDGGTPLSGKNVIALDLRAGIALLLAGLIAEGETHIENAWQIERGYENLLNKLQKLGIDAKY